MTRIKDAAVFINRELMDLVVEDIVEIHEIRLKNFNTDGLIWRDTDLFDPREGKRNGKRRAARPHGYRGETKVKVFFYDKPAHPMVPLRSSF